MRMMLEWPSVISCICIHWSGSNLCFCLVFENSFDIFLQFLICFVIFFVCFVANQRIRVKILQYHTMLLTDYDCWCWSQSADYGVLQLMLVRVSQIMLGSANWCWAGVLHQLCWLINKVWHLVILSVWRAFSVSADQIFETDQLEVWFFSCMISWSGTHLAWYLVAPLDLLEVLEYLAVWF